MSCLHFVLLSLAAVYQLCEFKSRRGKNKNLTAKKNLILTLFGLIFRRIYKIVMSTIFSDSFLLIMVINEKCTYILNIIIWQQSNSAIFNILYRIMKKSLYIRLKIKPNSVRIRSLSCQICVLPSTGFELTPLMHCSTNRLALCPAQ
jgi:hypothetical protein